MSPIDALSTLLSHGDGSCSDVDRPVDSGDRTGRERGAPGPTGGRMTRASEAAVEGPSVWPTYRTIRTEGIEIIDA